MTILDLDALRSFAVFADRLNFTRAAEALHLSQPSLHVKIRKLADVLGVPLYRRTGRRLELTEAGRRTAAFGREMDERSASFQRELAAGADDAPVVLAAGEGAYLHLLGPALRRFARGAPGRLRLLTRDAEGAVDDVRSGKAHLGVASLEGAPEGLETRELARVRPVLAMPVRDPLARRAEVTLADLDGRALVVPPPGRPHRAVLARALQSARVSWTAAVEAGGWALMLEFVRLGVGLAVVNGFVELPRGVAARPLRGLPDVVYHLFHRPGAAREGAAARLKRTLLERA